MHAHFGTGLHVLVVDDEPTIIEVLGEVLGHHGFTVAAAGDVAAAQRRIAAGLPDLLIVDKNLPDHSGLALVRALAGADVAVVMITGFSNLASAVEAMQLGVADYVVKPFELTDLTARLHRVVEALTLRRANTRLLAELAEKTRVLEGMVIRDALTGLFNHAHFQDALAAELDHARRHGQVVSVLMLDIDRFDQINATHGHQVGDEVLRVVGRMLCGEGGQGGFHRRGDIVARVGGDELALILPDTPKPGACVAGERLRGAVAEACAAARLPAVTLSIGLATFPDDAPTREAMIAATDVALAAAKRGGRNQVIAYSAALTEAGGVGTELGRLRALDRTIEERHFHLVYQPIVSADRALFGYEVLVRPTDPMLPSPLVLIDVAQRSGKMPQLGRALRAELVPSLAALPAGAAVFVNVHPHEILAHGFVTDEPALLPWASRMVFEITESAAITDYARVRSVIDRLRTIGFRFALDDLGAGYSGLNCLAILAPDFVKLDMALVRELAISPRTARMVRHLLEFARGEELGVIAEGIETEAEQAAVQALGVPYLQGYRFGRPARTFLPPLS